MLECVAFFQQNIQNKPSTLRLATLREWLLQHFIVLQTFILQLYPGKKSLFPTKLLHCSLNTQIRPQKHEHLERRFAFFPACAVMDRTGTKRSSCCFNVQSITSKSALSSLTGLGILQVISIFLYLEYQVEIYQPFMWCSGSNISCFMKHICV